MHRRDILKRGHTHSTCSTVSRILQACQKGVGLKACHLQAVIRGSNVEAYAAHDCLITLAWTAWHRAGADRINRVQWVVVFDTFVHFDSCDYHGAENASDAASPRVNRIEVALVQWP